MTPDEMHHFEQLRNKINARLLELKTKYAQEQIERFPWLYGAHGQVPSRVMFICENPSLTGVINAGLQTIDGGPPDIEAQWWGGPRNNAAKRFRVVLHDLGLKTTPPTKRGGWRCYITNVVKEANLATDQNALSNTFRRQQARDWADILTWEIEKVRPEHYFSVGGWAAHFVQTLQREKLLPGFHAHQICHYSARKNDAFVIERMSSAIRTACPDL